MQSVRYRLEAGWSPEQIIDTPFSYTNKLQNGEIVSTSKNLS